MPIGIASPCPATTAIPEAGQWRRRRSTTSSTDTASGTASGSVTGRASALAPFGVRSFRFQWPADLCTSWAFEMEALILGWYVLTTTGSVEQLVVFAAL